MNLPVKEVVAQGKPRRFPTEQDFHNAMVEYLEACATKYKHFPNVAGFCVYHDITRETFYKQKEYYSDTYKKIQDMLENAVINSSHGSDTMKIFYLKNKFGFRDRMENTITQDEPLKVTVSMDKLSDDELLLLKDLTAKATIK